MSANSAVHISEKRYTDGDIAILFVHGIQGSPNQFRFLLERLENNVSYYNLLLPGHGANYLEFRASGVAQWLDSVCCGKRASLEIQKGILRRSFHGMLDGYGGVLSREHLL